jgi:hypothetical protein
VVWLRGYFSRQFGRYRGERRFAVIAACAFTITFLVGNLLYPTYKVRVRAEFFDNPAAVAEELRLREAQSKLTAEAPATMTPPGLSSIARLFDIKEHWVALGCAASLLLLLLSRLAHPREQPSSLVLYLGLALLVCATAWWGAIVGLVTVSFRAVGKL